MKKIKSAKTIPNGEKIRGNNLLSKYVSKDMILIYSSEIIAVFKNIFTAIYRSHATLYKYLLFEHQITVKKVFFIRQLKFMQT